MYCYPGDKCDYACAPGYAKSGEHECGVGGAFEGGACRRQCPAAGKARNSQTACSGLEGDTCSLVCTGPGGGLQRPFIVS